jgi:hypothetical protein
VAEEREKERVAVAAPFADDPPAGVEDRLEPSFNATPMDFSEKRFVAGPLSVVDLAGERRIASHEIPDGAVRHAGRTRALDPSVRRSERFQECELPIA